MTTIQLHPRSLVLGLAIGACALFAMAQSAAPVGATVRVQYMPHPRDMVQIEEGVPYTVPVGKVFVLTGLGATQPTGGSTFLYVNGVPEASAETIPGGIEKLSIREVPLGFTARPGDVLVLDSSGSLPSPGRAWGYLADQ